MPRNAIFLTRDRAEAAAANHSYRSFSHKCLPVRRFESDRSLTLGFAVVFFNQCGFPVAAIKEA